MCLNFWKIVVNEREVKVNFVVEVSDKYLCFSLAVHPDRVTIATGQVAGTSKDGKVRFVHCLPGLCKDPATTSWKHFC